MRIGVIGVGRIGALHAATLRGLPDVSTVAVADADPARAAELAERERDQRTVTEAFPSVAELLASKPDGVVVTTPTPTHAELVIAAVELGIGVFCEKPLAPDTAGTRQVLETAHRHGVPLQLGFQRRFDPGFVAARERLHDGSLGRLQSIFACTMDPAPPDPSYLPTSGGIFRDCSVHDIDAVRWSSGQEIVEVYATGSDRGADYFRTYDDLDTAHAVLTLADGTHASIVATRFNGAGYEGRLELHGSDGTATAGLEGVQQVSYAGFADRFGAAYAAELEAFCALLTGRIENPCPGAEALAALQVADACELSRRERRSVRVNEVVG